MSPRMKNAASAFILSEQLSSLLPRLSTAICPPPINMPACRHLHATYHVILSRPLPFSRRCRRMPSFAHARAAADAHARTNTIDQWRDPAGDAEELLLFSRCLNRAIRYYAAEYYTASLATGTPAPFYACRQAATLAGILLAASAGETVNRQGM